MEELIRQCKHCHQPFPLTDFKRINTLYRGHTCSLCRSIKRKAQYWNDPQRHRQYVNNYSARYRDEINQRQNQRRKQDPERARLQYRKTYQQRRKECIEYQRRHRASMTPEQQERVRTMARPVKVAHQNKRRALKAGVPSEIVRLKDILERDGPTCYLCGKTLDPDIKGQVTLDHVIPLTKGGPHMTENVRIACMTCNTRKGNRTLEEFFQLHCLSLTSHTDQRGKLPSTYYSPAHAYVRRV